MMGYDAVAVGSNDLTGGEQFIQQMRQADFPWISANVFDISGELIFNPYLVENIGGITVAILALTGSGTNHNNNIIVSDWKEPLQLQLKNLATSSDMIILLSNLPLSENKIIGQNHPEIDMIITSDKTRGNLAPQISGNALITQTAARGKYLGKLSIQYTPEGKWSESTMQSEKESSKPDQFKTNFIAIKPRSSRSREINMLIADLKERIKKQ